nr:HD domain-containing phosphohydrolase [Pseudoalteromonas sp. R3]
MDGTGYPRGLTREQMSVPARIMAIADIFEALTAADRPYKDAKKLSECLFIMGKMKLGDHIDPDLFDVFVSSKVYLKYAQQFLKPEQIDEVIHEKIPGYEKK